MPTSLLHQKLPTSLLPVQMPTSLLPVQLPTSLLPVKLMPTSLLPVELPTSILCLWNCLLLYYLWNCLLSFYLGVMSSFFFYLCNVHLLYLLPAYFSSGLLIFCLNQPTSKICFLFYVPVKWSAVVLAPVDVSRNDPGKAVPGNQEPPVWHHYGHLGKKTRIIRSIITMHKCSNQLWLSLHFFFSPNIYKSINLLTTYLLMFAILF